MGYAVNFLLLTIAIFVHFNVIISQKQYSLNVTATWSNIQISVKEKKILSIKNRGFLYNGRLVGLLGPSGSGKSTFLNVLADKINNGRTYKVQSDFNRVIDTAKTGDSGHVSPVAFIHQDDHFFSMLTVRETLSLAASLRLQSRNVSNQVQRVISLLALSSVADSTVGDSNKRGISGGERKRLAVASELLGRPRLLLADEPTSGLDSFQAYSVMIRLSQLAREDGMTVVCAIHQPCSEIWALFDDLLLMSGGRIAYFGPREGALAHFESLGYLCPILMNPAEFLIDLVSHNTSSPDALNESMARVNHILEMYEIISKNQLKTNAESNFQNNSKSFENSFDSTMVNYSDHKKDKPKLFKRALSSLGHLPVRIGKALTRSSFRFLLLLQRASRQALRDFETNTIRMVVSGVLAVVVSSVFGSPTGVRDITPNSVAGRVNLLSQSVVNVGMMSVVKTLQLLKRERLLVDRERASRQYTSAEYLVAKSLVELPMDALYAAFFALVLHRCTDIRMSATELTELLALFSISCSSFGLAVGSIFPTGDVALAVGPAIAVLYVIVGVFVSVGKSGAELPAVLKPVRLMSPMRWASEALCLAEFKGRSFRISSSSVDTSKNVADAMNGNRRGQGQIFQSALSGVRNLGSLIKHVAQSITHPSGTGIRDGDRVIESLGIPPNETKHHSADMLVRLICGHLLVALIGLVIRPPNE